VALHPGLDPAEVRAQALAAASTDVTHGDVHDPVRLTAAARPLDTHARNRLDET